MSNAEDPNQPPPLPPITFFAHGPTEDIRIANLEAVLPSPGYPYLCHLIADTLVKRADFLVLDYNRDSVQMRLQIDGIWHNLPPQDRATGDYMLATMKKLSNLNYQERRARQEGEFACNLSNHTTKVFLTSQGVQTGERVVLEFDRVRPKLDTLVDLGMREKLADHLVKKMHEEKGFVVFSTLPGDGLSTMWHAALSNCDRLMKDYVVIQDEADREKDIINVDPRKYDSRAGQSALDILPEVMLKQPDVVCFPEVDSPQILNRMLDMVVEEEKMVMTRIHAKSAVESLLRLLVHQPNVSKLAKAITCVVHQRLARRLCSNCKIAYQPNPQVLHQLGIPPGRVSTFFAKWQPPPPGQVDEHGNPIEVQPCHNCGNLGFCERVGVFEMLEINDTIRQVLVSQPNLQALTQAATQSGYVSLRDEGVVLLAQGHTSIEELQRVLAK